MPVRKPIPYKLRYKKIALLSHTIDSLLLLRFQGFNKTNPTVQ